jgi:hypothetical protein
MPGTALKPTHGPRYRGSMERRALPPLVLIEWLDSGQPAPAWQWLDSIGPKRPHRCVSVGFLVQDDDHAKVLAPNLGSSEGAGPFDQASGLTTIPTASVKRILRVTGSAASPCSPASACPDAASAPTPPAS